MPKSRLLPQGIYDLLPPYASTKRRIVNTLLDYFETCGYAQVESPLVEFEESILDAQPEGMKNNAFRTIDGANQKIMVIRPDITLQTARIATTRLIHEALPVKLCYAGDVLWTSGWGLKRERQHTQAGIELIGCSQETADAEVISAGIAALTKLGITDISIDLNLPTLPRSILHMLGIDEAMKPEILSALASKDVSYAAVISPVLKGLVESVGLLPDALRKLESINLPLFEAQNIASLKNTYNYLKDKHPEVALTLDVTESRGFEYHTGIAYTFFAKATVEEIGRGGSYDLSGENGKICATGFSFYVNPILRLVTNSI